MTDVFDNILRSNETIFLNDVALSYDFVPREVPYRENEHHYIATCIKPLFYNRNGKNLFIYGSPGIGKTLAVKSVLRELEEQTDDILKFYINCWKHNTTYKVIIEICNLINYRFLGEKSTDELINNIKPILNKKSVVICLDEVDKLENDDILYFILEDLYKKTLLLITNERLWLDDLDNRIRSRLYAETINFKEYNYEETFDILKKRCEYAFYPNVISKELIEEISKKASEIKDIRSGIYLLKESGDIAESRASKKILIEDVKIALEKLKDFQNKNSSNLSNEKNDILELIKGNSGKTSTDLFNVYNKDISYRTFRRKLEELEKSKLITVDEKSIGAKGKATYVYFGTIKNLNEF